MRREKLKNRKGKEKLDFNIADDKKLSAYGCRACAAFILDVKQGIIWCW